MFPNARGKASMRFCCETLMLCSSFTDMQVVLLFWECVPFLTWWLARCFTIKTMRPPPPLLLNHRGMSGIHFSMLYSIWCRVQCTATSSLPTWNSAQQHTLQQDPSTQVGRSRLSCFTLDSACTFHQIISSSIRLYSILAQISVLWCATVVPAISPIILFKSVQLQHMRRWRKPTNCELKPLKGAKVTK